MPLTDDIEIDLERVVIDPDYRRRIIVQLNARARAERELIEDRAASAAKRQSRAA